MKNSVKSNAFFGLGLVLFTVAMSWLFLLTPRAHNIEIIKPDLNTVQDSLSSFQFQDMNPEREGLYWVKFTTKPMIYPLQHLKLRTMNCVHEMSTQHGEWNLPTNLNTRCDNFAGFKLNNTRASLAKETTWHFAGSTKGDSYGVLLEKDWSDLPVALGLSLVVISLMVMLSAKLPAMPFFERTSIVAVLAAAFLFRFWLVFIKSPPEFSLFSDMAGYFHRGEEIMRGEYTLSQLFQPAGFTLWSLWLRQLGSFELFNWSQVFLSWGTVVLIYLIVRERFGALAGAFSALISASYIPLAGFATFHMAENAYAFLITLFLWLMMKTLKHEKLSGYFAMGLLLALAFYFKGNHAFFIPILGLWLLYRERHHFTRAFVKVSVMAIGCLLIVVPHMAWTWKHYGKPQLGPTAGALNFIEGKCPSKDNADSSGARWMSPLFHFTNERTFKQWDQPFTNQGYFWKEGMKCVAENPAVLASSFRYIYYLAWGNPLWPIISNPTKELYYPWENFFYYALLPLSLLGLLVLRKSEEPFNKATVLLMLSLFLTVWFFKSENRFRVPFDALLISWGSLGAAWLSRLAVHVGNLLIQSPIVIQITDQEKTAGTKPDQT